MTGEVEFGYEKKIDFVNLMFPDWCMVSIKSI